MPMPSEATRAYAYRILVAVLPVLTLYGIINESDLALWLNLAAAVLGVGLAAANTSRNPEV